MTDSLDYETVIKTEIFAEGNAITPKLLSRKLEVSIAQAREYLESFQNNSKDDIHATYVVTGNVKKVAKGVAQMTNSFGNYQPVSIVDSFQSISLDEPREYLEFTITVAPQEKLDETKSLFSEIKSVQIYSLAKQHSNDTILLTTAETKAKTIDKANKSSVRDLQHIYGMIRNTLLPDDFVPTEGNAALSKSKVSAYLPSKRAESVSNSSFTQEGPTARTADRKAVTTISHSGDSKPLAVSNHSASHTAKKVSQKSKSAQSFFSAAKSASSTNSGGKSTNAKSGPLHAHTHNSEPSTKTENDKFNKDHEMRDVGNDNDSDAENDTQVYEENENVDSNSMAKQSDTSSVQAVHDDLKDMFADLEQDQQHTDTENNEEKDDQMEYKENDNEDVEMEDVDENTGNGEEEKELDEPTKPDQEPVDEEGTASTEPEPLVQRSSNGKKRVKKLRKTRGIDKFGYYTMHTEEVWVTDEEGEDEKETKDDHVQSTSFQKDNHEKNSASKQSAQSDKSDTKPSLEIKSKPANSKPATSKKGKGKKGDVKQGSLMSFFKK